MSMSVVTPLPTTPAADTCSVAIIGTEGTGKTVLVTTLATRFSNITDQGLFLKPTDNRGETYKYIARNWESLSKGKWPPLTKKGELFQLQWQLQANHKPVADLRMLDVSGEDLRLLFNDGQIDTPEQLPEGLRRITDYLCGAQIVLVLVDMDDIVSNRNTEHARETQWVINYALDCAKKRRDQVRIALVFTKSDKYEPMAKQHGGWLNTARKYLPLVYGNHLADGQLSVFPVAAVANTQLDTSSGTPYQVPAPNFASQGLEELMNWVHIEADALTKAVAVKVAVEKAEQDKIANDTAVASAAAMRAHLFLQATISFGVALIVCLLAQIIMIPVLSYLCRTQTTVKVETTVPRQEWHAGTWIPWTSGHYETVQDNVVYDKIEYPTSYTSVAVWDVLLTLVILCVVWRIMYTYRCQNTSPSIT